MHGRSTFFCFLPYQKHFIYLRKTFLLMDVWYVWIIVAIVLFIVEVLTQILWALCLGIGALAAMAAALAGVSTVWQVIIMAVVGILVYVIALPRFRNFHNKQSLHEARTGMDALLGRRAIVTEEIRPGQAGRARIDGDNWQVIAPGVETAIHRGTEVVVTGYDSIILTVTLPS